MSGPEFELLVAGLFEKMGFQVELTKASHDGGIDIIAHCHVPLLSPDE
jgi:HJR/Mrr/RecB family endonuclease